MMLSSIKINSVIYVPMLTKIYDLEEARFYDNFTNEQFQGISNNKE